MGNNRIGFIGAGQPGAGTSRGYGLAALCERLGFGTVEAVHDIDLPRAEEVAAKFASCKAYGELEAFLESGIDSVIVATPVQVHAEHSIAALQHDLNVFSEVTACANLEQAQALADAAKASRGKYMFGENYCYFDEVELVKRMYQAGRFGEAMFAEGEYVHDCRSLAFDKDGQPTWRGRGLGRAVYCTHSLGPILYWLDERVISVSAQAVENAEMSLGIHMPFNHNILMKTESGRVIRLRVDCVSPRPHRVFYSLQGTRGAYESGSGKGDDHSVWFADQHEDSGVHSSAGWHPLSDYAREYTPDRVEVSESGEQYGHGASEYWMLKDFFESIAEDRTPPIDVYKGLDYTVPGICAVESFERGGELVLVPDYR